MVRRFLYAVMTALHDLSILQWRICFYFQLILQRVQLNKSYGMSETWRYLQNQCCRSDDAGTQPLHLWHLASIVQIWHEPVMLYCPCWSFAVNETLPLSMLPHLLHEIVCKLDGSALDVLFKCMLVCLFRWTMQFCDILCWSPWACVLWCKSNVTSAYCSESSIPIDTLMHTGEHKQMMRIRFGHTLFDGLLATWLKWLQCSHPLPFLWWPAYLPLAAHVPCNTDMSSVPFDILCLMN